MNRDPETRAWVLELDRVIDSAGRVSTVRLLLDEQRGPAHPIRVGNRLEVEGRLFAPVLPGGIAGLEPARITQLSDPGLRHAYFLFRSGRSEGCAECYIPLVLTAEPVSGSAPVSGAEVIITFERDSIWEIHRGPSAITEVEPLARTLRLNGKPYRYQEVPLDEPIRLLTNPFGSIPISRPLLQDAPTDTRRRALLLRLGVPQSQD